MDYHTDKEDYRGRYDEYIDKQANLGDTRIQTAHTDMGVHRVGNTHRYRYRRGVHVTGRPLCPHQHEGFMGATEGVGQAFSSSLRDVGGPEGWLWHW